MYLSQVRGCIILHSNDSMYEVCENDQWGPLYSKAMIICKGMRKRSRGVHYMTMQ